VHADVIEIRQVGAGAELGKRLVEQLCSRSRRVGQGLREGGLRRVESLPYQRIFEAAAWMLTLMPCPKPSSQAVAISGGASPTLRNGTMSRSGLSSA
jgi:hypothetical protein